MTESQFKTRCVTLIKKTLPDVWVYHPTDRWISGIPDLLILYRGVFAAIELKVAKNKTSKIQDIVLARIQKAGGLTWVVSDRHSDGIKQMHNILALIEERANYRRTE